MVSIKTHLICLCVGQKAICLDKLTCSRRRPELFYMGTTHLLISREILWNPHPTIFFPTRLASRIKERRNCVNGKFHGLVDPSAPSSSPPFGWLALAGSSAFNTRPVKGSMGRVSRGPPLRPIITIGGGGSKPALKRMRWTGSEG